MLMKKLLAFLLVISLLCALPAFAEDALMTFARAVANAATIDEQLALLYDISTSHVTELETGGWEPGLTCRLAEPLSDDLLPPSEEMESVEMSVEDFSGMKFIALYDDWGTIQLLGDFQVRIPEAMRATSLEEADAVLYLVHTGEARSDYTGPAYNRSYYAYVFRRGSGKYTRIYRTWTTPPAGGYGTLYGEKLLLSDLWSGVRPWFYGTITLEYPEGTATYRIIGQSCCLAELDGEFTYYEIPPEVEGYPVVGIEYCDCATLKELVLPEGIVWIERVKGDSLRRMNFPSTLRRISKNNNPRLEETLLNEGLEEIGDFAIQYGHGENFALPSTLKTMGRGVLAGADSPYIVVPEGVTALNDFFLTDTSRVLCVYVPASVTSFGSTLFNNGCILIYTPEGSKAASFAALQGYPWVPCERPEDMPRPVYAVEDGFEYAIVEGEAILTRYYGDAECLRVPDTLGGCPVAIIREKAFNQIDTLHALMFPDTVRKMERGAVHKGSSLKAVFVPASVTDYHFQAIYIGGTIYVVPDSVPAEELESDIYHNEPWISGAEEAWFPAE